MTSPAEHARAGPAEAIVQASTRARQSLLEIVLRTHHKYQADRCAVMAAAISYRVLFSIVPATAVAVAVVGWILQKPEIRTDVVNQVTHAIPLEKSLVIDALGAVSASSQPLTVVGAVLLLWAASGMFSTIRESLNTTWGGRGRSFVGQKLVDLATMIGLGALVAFSILGGAALDTVKAVAAVIVHDATPGPAWIWNWANGLLPAIITFTAFLYVYRYLPNVQHTFRDVVPGAVLGTVAFEITKHAFGFYTARFDRYEMVYGALGTVMLFLVWVFVSANILLIGAELNAVYAERRGDYESSSSTASPTRTAPSSTTPA